MAYIQLENPTETDMPKSDAILVLTGPEYAMMHLTEDKSFYPRVSLQKILELMDQGATLWGNDSGGAELSWCTTSIQSDPPEIQGMTSFDPIVDYRQVNIEHSARGLWDQLIADS